MNKKTIKRMPWILIGVVIAGFLSWFVYGIIWTARFNSQNAAAADAIPSGFVLKQPITHDADGRFLISAAFGDNTAQSFILDTQASGMMRSDSISKYGEQSPNSTTFKGTGIPD